MGSINPGVIRLRVFGLLTTLVLVLALAMWVHAGSPKEKINTNWLGVAIKGYDPVAYFTEGRAVKGKKEFEYKWQDAKWRFASAANREKFAANPAAYAPKYGGFWASAIAAGSFASVDPEAWKIIDGNLYLNWSKKTTGEFFGQNAAVNIKKADKKWAEMTEKD